METNKALLLEIENLKSENKEIKNKIHCLENKILSLELRFDDLTIADACLEESINNCESKMMHNVEE